MMMTARSKGELEAVMEKRQREGKAVAIDLGRRIDPDPLQIRRRQRRMFARGPASFTLRGQG
jgi:hypothetical protein